MALVRPRLNDFHRLAFTQEEADFVIRLTGSGSFSLLNVFAV